MYYNDTAGLSAADTRAFELEARNNLKKRNEAARLQRKAVVSPTPQNKKNAAIATQRAVNSQTALDRFLIALKLKKPPKPVVIPPNEMYKRRMEQRYPWIDRFLPRKNPAVFVHTPAFPRTSFRPQWGYYRHGNVGSRRAMVNYASGYGLGSADLYNLTRNNIRRRK